MCLEEGAAAEASSAEGDTTFPLLSKVSFGHEETHEGRI